MTAADAHLEPGRKRIFGQKVTFNLTLSGAQVGGAQPLESLDEIVPNFKSEGVASVLDFGAGRLRNTKRLEREKSWLRVSFSEYAAFQSHELDRDLLRNDKAIAGRLRGSPSSAPARRASEEILWRDDLAATH